MNFGEFDLNCFLVGRNERNREMIIRQQWLHDFINFIGCSNSFFFTWAYIMVAQLFIIHLGHPTSE